MHHFKRKKYVSIWYNTKYTIFKECLKNCPMDNIIMVILFLPKLNVIKITYD